MMYPVDTVKRWVSRHFSENKIRVSLLKICLVGVELAVNKQMFQGHKLHAIYPNYILGVSHYTEKICFGVSLM